MRQQHRPRLLLLVAASTSLLVGCSATPGTSAARPGESPSPRQTRSDVVTAAPTTPATPRAPAATDFCALTGRMMDAATGYQDDKVSAEDYLASMQRAAANAPAELSDDVTFLVTEMTRNVKDLEGTGDGDTTPIDTAKLLASRQAWKDWTIARCAPGIAAKWAGK